jgi:hypothetical protein
LTNLLSALKNKGYPEVDFVLPLQIDLDTRLNQDGTRGLGDDDDPDEQINTAIDNFTRAIKIDPEYFIGYFNLAIAFWLKKDDLNLELNLRKAKSLSSIEQNDNIILFEAIMGYKSSDELKRHLGIAQIESLAKKGNALANANLNMFNKVEDNQEKMYPALISKYIDLKNLPTNLSGANNILDSTFSRDVYRTLTCKQVNNKITYRKWKFIKGEESHIAFQYIMTDDFSFITEKEKQNLISSAKIIFETAMGLFLVFEDVIIKIDLNNKVLIQIIKSV